MKKMKTAILAVTLAFSGAAFAEAGKKHDNSEVMKACKAECPNSKTDDALHDCIETKMTAPGDAGKKFKASKCFIAHEKHEKENHGENHNH